MGTELAHVISRRSSDRLYRSLDPFARALRERPLFAHCRRPWAVLATCHGQPTLTFRARTAAVEAAALLAFRCGLLAGSPRPCSCARTSRSPIDARRRYGLGDGAASRRRPTPEAEQVAVAHLCDAPQPRFAAGRVLARCQAEEGRELTPAREGAGVLDGGHNRRGGDRADAGN